MSDEVGTGAGIAISLAAAVNVTLFMLGQRFDTLFTSTTDHIEVLVLTGLGMIGATGFYKLLDRFFPLQAMNIWGALAAVFLIGSMARHEFIVGLMHVTPVVALFVVLRASRSMAGR